MNDSKIIETLDCAIREAYGEGWDFVDLLIEDAQEILVALRRCESRVMTYEEIKDNLGVPVWVEYADDENWNGYGVPTSDHKAYIMIYGANAYCAHNVCSHNVKWRCWTSRPSEQQMRDTKWEDKVE